jgi:predicted RNase H-like HicB family nuclease
MHFSIHSVQEPDGHWRAEVPEFPGMVGIGSTREEAITKAELRALTALAERRFRFLRAR